MARGRMAAEARPDPSHRIVSIVGTRPEAIKMAPVVRALAERPSIDQRILLTGQHAGLAGAFDALPASAIDRLDLDLREHSAAELRDTLRDAIGARLASDRPDLVIVQGDTGSALAGALAARDYGVPLAHVEAGLRSFDPTQPWPEEENRIAIDALADLLFAPTEAAAANLAAEPAVTGAVHVTGNSGIDALFHARAAAAPPSPPASARRTILVTCHRRENQGAPLVRICGALKRLVAAFPVQIVFPLHPNRHIRAAVERELSGVPNIDLIPPIGHSEMVRRILGCWLILTDSGGLQEEGPALGRPVLVMRDLTERVEAPANVELVGTRQVGIVAAVNRLLMNDVHYARMAQPALPFGDGQAAPRIAELVEGWLSGLARRALAS